MFDVSKSKAFKELKNVCPDLKMDTDRLGREISCGGVCHRKEKVISFCAESMPEQFEETLMLGVKAFSNLDEYVEKGKDAICKDFLPVYREDDDPDMTEEAFKDKLLLVSVGAFSGSVITVDFCDSGMIGGHVLGANSLDKGETFTETEM